MVAAAVAAVVIAVAAIVVVAQSNRGTGGGEPATIDRPVDTTPVSAVWSIPKAFLGQWKGVAEDAARTFDVELIVKPGKNSEELVVWAQTDKASGSSCTRVGRVVTVDETELTLAVRPSGGTDCADGATNSVIRLQPDDSMRYRAGATTGTLHRA